MHETEIPSIVANTHPEQEDCSTELCYALASSLAVAKRLTWEQTPWLFPGIHGRANWHIHGDIYRFLPAHVRRSLRPESLAQALYFGEARAEDDPPNTHLRLYVVFPHLSRPVVHLKDFINIWHDAIVAPAFNQAWEDSDLVDLYPNSKSKSALFLHDTMAHRAIGILKHLENGRRHALSEHWPAFHDPKDEQGREGRFSDKRAEILDEAWKSIKGMLKDNPLLPKGEFEDPILLIVDQSRVDMNADMSPQQKYQAIGRNWDRWIDSRYLVRGSFKVIVETTLGEKFKLVRGQLGGVEKKRKVEAYVGGAVKRARLAKIEEDQEEMVNYDEKCMMSGALQQVVVD
ncbi:hypothetical protein BCR34DRAFT_608205 [Clohesyomyces aquaticus]|uniref:Uncharacterized protein n=1 Tax=Clohesyomyces aquaticus TaxID=1231657 RepID=A0A1Y1Y9H8_9PLEO|nr:hypothetical protein BCR34DRAFT_608205 [Clohesyomyces aquaticus]